MTRPAPRRTTRRVAGRSLPLLLKQVVVIIDSRTSIICLDAAGQTKPVGEPFQTLNGRFDHPPFHIHCRSTSRPWLSGMVSDYKEAAKQELARRAPRDRRRTPANLPPPAARAVRRKPARQTSDTVVVGALARVAKSGSAAAKFRRSSLTALQGGRYSVEDMRAMVQLVQRARSMQELPVWLRRVIQRRARAKR